jgi:peptidoglycan/LPS O-acetylase OafA/YrhL
VTKSPSTSRRNNNFGFLRLLFATLVIVSHSSELIDGNRSREFLTRLFRTLSFAQLAVDGFFLISGYLITCSWAESGSNSEYITKRVLRIYPGYLVAYIFSLFVIGPLAGGHLHFNLFYIGEQIFHMAILDEPTLPGAFVGLPFQDLNGSMWTIAYEFRCYLLAMVLGTFGILRGRKIFLGVTLMLLLVLVTLPGSTSPNQVDFTFESVRFCAVFCAGGAFFLFRDRIRYSWKNAVLAATLLIPLMFFPRVAHAAWAVLGGYLLFWFAFRAKANSLSRIDNRFDLSYGLYLYAWPVQNLLLWRFRIFSPWLLFASAMMGIVPFAYASWTFIERPCLGLKKLVFRKGPTAETAGCVGNFTDPDDDGDRL